MVGFFELCVKTSIFHECFRFCPLPRLWPFAISIFKAQIKSKISASPKLYYIWQWKCIGWLSENIFLALNTSFVHTMDHIHCRCVWLLSTYGFRIVRLAIFLHVSFLSFHPPSIYLVFGWDLLLNDFRRLFFSSLFSSFLHSEDSGRQRMYEMRVQNFSFHLTMNVNKSNGYFNNL